MPAPRLVPISLAFLTASLAVGPAIVAQAPGLRLFSPTGANQIQLVDGQGSLVHSWPGVDNVTAHMLDDGSVLCGRRSGSGTGGSTGLLQRMAFDGAILWDVLVPDMHHDLEPMPNGNVLVIVWDRDTAASAIAAGRDPALITGTDWLPDSILEIQPTGPTSGTVVWEWHIMDHVIQEFDPGKPNYGVIADHPELVDLNFPPQVVTNGDWNHANGLDYDPDKDWIILSSRSQNEIYLIDHSTTTAEAAGHTGGLRGKGGDILYRWGNPQAYGAGTLLNQWLRGQHDPRFLPAGYAGAGNITLFNNNYGATQSAVHEIALPLDASGNIVLDPGTGRYGPVAPVWTFTEPTFFSQFVSSAERLANGNTLICSGMQNRLFEVTPIGQTVWSYVYPNTGIVFQAHSVDRSLWADADELSVAGGQVGFDHRVDSQHTGEMYLLLGSISGTTPGTLVPGGVTMPLNVDFLTSAMASQFNTGVFTGTLGLVGALGDGSSAIVVPPGFIPAALTGVQMDFAHLIYDASLQAVRASNTVAVTIVP